MFPFNKQIGFGKTPKKKIFPAKKEGGKPLKKGVSKFGVSQEGHLGRERFWEKEVRSIRGKLSREASYVCGPNCGKHMGYKQVFGASKEGSSRGPSLLARGWTTGRLKRSRNL